MAGRGRGRGRGASMSFSVESLGFGRGEALPTSIVEPPPIYPPLEFKPVPLTVSEENNYLLSWKQALRRTMKNSPYYLKLSDEKKDIKRYSDKYKMSSHDNGDLRLDWKRFPSELRIKAKKKAHSKIKPKVKQRTKVNEDDITKTLEVLEKKEETEGGEEEAEAEEEEGEGQVAAEDEEELDEEDFEDETDYIQTYFDNGENYNADEDDDLDDGPTY